MNKSDNPELSVSNQCVTSAILNAHTVKVAREASVLYSSFIAFQDLLLRNP